MLKMSKNKDLPLILLDSDVIIHFLKDSKLHILDKIFPKRFVILDKVKEEVCKRNKTEIENFIKMCKIEILDFPKTGDVVKEYAHLKRKFGEGESACMAVAKFQKQYLASSNLRDIKVYCEANKITYLTTMDILLEAYKKKILDLSECDLFIFNVKSKGSKLPFDSIESHPDFKLNS